jgi:hypothetical protein
MPPKCQKIFTNVHGFIPSRIGYSGRHMDLRGREKQMNGKKLLMKSFMVCTP